jgi:hypothetical protein
MHRASRRAAIVFCASACAALHPRADDIQAEAERWWSHVRFLAADALQGRNTGSEGHRKAAEYVAGQFERNGCGPAGGAGFIETVPFRARRILEERSSLELVRGGRVEPLVLGDDAIFNLRGSETGSIAAEAVFAGYGLTVPERSYDDLAGLDVRGKFAVVVSGGPEQVPDPSRAHYQSAAERWKALKQAGALGTVLIQNPRTSDIPWPRQAAARLAAAMSLEDPGLDETQGQKLSVTFNPARAEKLFSGSGHTWAEILALADASRPLPHFPLGVSLRAKLEAETSRVESQNVIARLEGSDPSLKNEYVVLTAHLDHLGVGSPVNGDRIYNGAMDNASGVASLIEISRLFHETARRGRRSLLFAAVTGEEKGLAGSRHLAAHPPVEIERVVANLNMDMFLPLFPLRIVMAQGLDESDLGDQLRTVARELSLEVQADPEPERNRFIRSDQYSFIRRGIPALAFKFGYRKGSPEETIHKEWTRTRYHAPSDDLDQPVDKVGAARFNRLLAALAERVANETSRPHWKPESFFRRFAR